MRDAEGKQLVADCLGGDGTARARFQEQFGPLIYRLAEILAEDAPVEPGDFYLYVFDKDRLYSRLRSYRGEAALGAYLRGYALRDLFTDFVRSAMRRRTPDTVSLDTGNLPGAIAASDMMDQGGLSQHEESDSEISDRNLFERLGDENQVLLKLLYIEDYTLNPRDLQSLAKQSERSIGETVALIENARESVRLREAEKRRHVEEAESTAGWLLRYDRRLERLTNGLRNVPPGTTQAERLGMERAELERKRVWRRQQHRRALDRSRRARVTLRYRDIAHILNVPIGSVAARVARLRQELRSLGARSMSVREG